MTLLDYKGYQGSVEADLDTGTLFGKVLFVNDLVTYEGTTLPELQVQFRASVEDYLQTCQSLARDPQQPCNGVFNVRVSPGLHRSASIRALRDGVKLNAVVVSALEQYRNNPDQHTRQPDQAVTEVSLVRISNGTHAPHRVDAAHVKPAFKTAARPRVRNPV